MRVPSFVKQPLYIVIGLVMSTASAPPAYPQKVAQKAPRTTPVTGSVSKPTMIQQTYRSAQGAGLQPTRLDSFVTQAGAYAEQIYGGDSSMGKPLFNNFTKDHRINAGISGGRNEGITTGHGSYMPDAWGADEFTSPGPEFSQSGTTGQTTLIPIDARAKQDPKYQPSSGDSAPAPTPVLGTPIPPYPNDGKLYRINIINGKFAGWVPVM